ncbi:hypothetical protein NC653_000035 [Populus alba x Populus x berolinensis]|uniref:Uncharacterized protein n=1 Tax=Populus alba x Populus x berolinensis TaxID=444605 RepID=A0AAD6RHR1_9ROSI|nr:hypothetical protein NC653_000035 [Populus alba x Populus x berolinensis]
MIKRGKGGERRLRRERETGKRIKIKRGPERRIGQARKSNEEDYDGKFQMDYEDEVDKDTRKQGKVSFRDEDEQSAEGASAGAHTSASELEQRILKMKEERTKKKPESVSDVF